MNEEIKNQQIPDMEMPTPEQIAVREAQRAAMIEFYKKDLKNLEIEVKYNELQERIEKARYQTWQWRLRFDQMMAPPPQETDKVPEGNQTFKAAVEPVDNNDKGNVVPLTSVTTETKTEG